MDQRVTPNLPTVGDRSTEKGIKGFAENVETHKEFDSAKTCGYSYFQGHFFSKPIIEQGKKIPGNKLVCLRLLQQINRTEMSYEDMENIIKQDVSLTYKLLRFINSLWFGLRHKVRSIKHALVCLGPEEIRKWSALVSLQDMGVDKPDELMVQALIRARMAESMSAPCGLRGYGSDLFLMGMFSVLDALLDAPMRTILEKMPINEQIKTALLGSPGRFRTVYDMILHYERGDWGSFSVKAHELGIEEKIIPGIFNESLKWANQAFASI